MNRHATLALELIETRTEVIALKLDILLDKVIRMGKEFDNLKAQVERQTTLTQSVLTLLRGMADQIEALKNEPAKLQELADSMRTNEDAIEAAVKQNTPATP